MAIVQKLIIDKSKSSQYQLILRDETGVFTSSNQTGYGGSNGNPPENINRYLFFINNKNTGEKHLHIQGRNALISNEFVIPTIEDIVDKYNIPISSSEFNLDLFNIGVIEVVMCTEYMNIIQCEGYKNSEVIVNIPGAQNIYNNYTGIVAGNIYYKITGVAGSNLLIDRPIEEDFTEMRAALVTTSTFVLYDRLEDCLSRKLKNYLSQCKCSNSKDIDILSELYLLDWGIQRSIDKEDYIQAEEYLNLAFKICSTSKCNC